MRKKFPDAEGNMRKLRTGKMIAQGAHASMKVILDMMDTTVVFRDAVYYDKTLPCEKASPLDEWINGLFTKVCVGVDTEEELLDLYEKASTFKLPCALITDAGLTEFNGVPTNTCIAIGPAESDKIDAITGHLSLM